MGDATKIDMAEWDRDFRINVTSMVLMSRYAIPEMRKLRRGAIVNMSSVSGRKYSSLAFMSEIWSSNLCSVRREPESSLPDIKGSNYSDDESNGRASRHRKYQGQLCLSWYGIYADG
jgi:NAD(P)-dependent dehydrogenase (short-subunit alcohol dehydrogenase family)